jgi:uncharacterized protein YjiS (DUF1127 family)
MVEKRCFAAKLSVALLIRLLSSRQMGASAMPGSRQYGRSASLDQPGAPSTYKQENSSYLVAFFRLIGIWVNRVRTRRRLRELAEWNTRLLADVGLSQADALREASKPFWRR